MSNDRMPLSAAQMEEAHDHYRRIFHVYAVAADETRANAYLDQMIAALEADDLEAAQVVLDAMARHARETWPEMETYETPEQRARLSL